MITAISTPPYQPLPPSSCPPHPIEQSIHDILVHDRWIWENNAIVQNFPDFVDDDGFDAVDADTTRELLREALFHFEALFDAINGKQRVNETRAKVALTGLLVATNLSESVLLKPALDAAAAFYRLCERPTSYHAQSLYISSHTELTVALMQAQSREAVDDAWHSAFAYHSREPVGRVPNE